MTLEEINDCGRLSRLLIEVGSYDFNVDGIVSWAGPWSIYIRIEEDSWEQATTHGFILLFLDCGYDTLNSCLHFLAVMDCNLELLDKSTLSPQVPFCQDAL